MLPEELEIIEECAHCGALTRWTLSMTSFFVQEYIHLNIELVPHDGCMMRGDKIVFLCEKCFEEYQHMLEDRQEQERKRDREFAEFFHEDE